MDEFESLLEQGKFDEASDWLDAIEDTDPTNFFFKKILMLEFMGERDSAIQTLLLLKESKPAPEHAAIGAAWLADLYSQEGRYSSAMEEIVIACDLGIDDPEILDRLGSIINEWKESPEWLIVSAHDPNQKN